MFGYTVRRLLLMFPALLAVFTIVFILVRLAPGDPAMVVLGSYATPEALAAVREELGLNDPIWKQYLHFLQNLVQGNLGVSMINKTPVMKQLTEALPYTLELTFSSLAIGTFLGIPLGVFTALRRNRFGDYIGRVLSLAGISIPSFYLGILLLYFFAVRLWIFPVIGGGDPNDFADRFKHLVLPAVTMGSILTSYVMRITRSTMLKVLNEDFVRTARSKGLHEKIVIYKHALMNALIPVISLLGIYFIIILGASVMVEIVFSRPGLGKMMVMAMKERDYITLQSVMIVYAGLSILINLVIDLTYALIDPRIKYK